MPLPSAGCYPSAVRSALAWDELNVVTLLADAVGCDLHADNVGNLFQLCVLRPGLLKNGNVAVGVFPKCEELLIG
jgi:hypothetical protein